MDHVELPGLGRKSPVSAQAAEPSAARPPTTASRSAGTTWRRTPPSRAWSGLSKTESRSRPPSATASTPGTRTSSSAGNDATHGSSKARCCAGAGFCVVWGTERPAGQRGWSAYGNRISEWASRMPRRLPHPSAGDGTSHRRGGRRVRDPARAASETGREGMVRGLAHRAPPRPGPTLRGHVRGRRLRPALVPAADHRPRARTGRAVRLRTRPLRTGQAETDPRLPGLPDHAPPTAPGPTQLTLV